MYVHFPHGDQSGREIGFFLRVRLADDTFVAFSGRSGFVRIDSRYQDQPVLYLIVQSAEAADIIADRVFVVGGTGTDDDEKFIAFAGDYIADFLIPPLFQAGEMFRDRKLFSDFFRRRKFADKLKRHLFMPLSLVFLAKTHLL